MSSMRDYAERIRKLGDAELRLGSNYRGLEIELRVANGGRVLVCKHLVNWVELLLGDSVDTALDKVFCEVENFPR